jgi:hypothetical protein
VSRGIGIAQRRAMLALWDRAELEYLGVGAPLAELKRSISADRSNARRAIRGLVERGLAVEVTDDEGARRIKLTGGAYLACWLAQYGDAPLTLERVPGRPLVLDLSDDLGLVEEDTLGLDNPMDLGTPHGAPPPPSDRPVNDNAPSSRGRGDAMQARTSHASAPLHPERGVSDPRARDPGEASDAPMRAGMAHASTRLPPRRGVSDPGEAAYETGQERLARMAAQALERLDAEDAEEGEM